MVPGTNLVAISIPASATTVATFGRFRFSTAGGLTYSGFASDGEVEDYLMTIRPAVDLVLAQRESGDPIPVTSNFTYVVAVTNQGPSVASSVALTNILSPQVTFLAATPTQGSL